MVEEPLWTSSEISAISDAVCLSPWFADAVQTDSREVLPGDLFIALEGDNEDGHDYVSAALDRGAAAAVVHTTPKGVAKDDGRLVKVTDTLTALAVMARYCRERAPMKTIAVTGSAGKTSVVQALRKALERTGQTHSSIKSFNNHVGVPLSLSRIPRSTRYGVFELGMNRPGEIANHTTLVKPDVAIVTTVGAAHAQSFESIEAIAREKAAIFGGLKKGGTAIVNIDCAYADVLKSAAVDAGVNIITVSLDADAGADIFPITMRERYDCTCMTAKVRDLTVTYKISQPGPEWALNSLLILAAIDAVEADLGHAVLALASLEAEPGRGQMHIVPVANGNYTLIDDSYNANPLSVEASLKRVAKVPIAPRGRRIAVLADMQELGEGALDMHLDLAASIRRAGIDKIFAVGSMMEAMAERAGVAFEAINDVRGLSERLSKNLRDGDVVVIKGANSAGLGMTVNQLLRFGAEVGALQSFGQIDAGVYTQRLVAE